MDRVSISSESVDGDETNFSDLKTRYDKLNEYLNSTLDKIIELHREQIKTSVCCRKWRSTKVARICVKGVIGMRSDGDGQTAAVFDVFRENDEYRSEVYETINNTGFKVAGKTKRPYRCNNIPKDAKIGKYKNPRLVSGSLNLYKLPWLISFRRWSSTDKNWMSCWEPYTDSTLEQSKPPESCYKSTLVIPIVLRGSDGDSEFVELLKSKMKVQIGTGSSIDQVLGFLCFDHRRRGFFSNFDNVIGASFAEMLGIYLMTRYLLTSLSTTYENSQERLAEKGLIPMTQ